MTWRSLYMSDHTFNTREILATFRGTELRRIHFLGLLANQYISGMSQIIDCYARCITNDITAALSSPADHQVWCLPSRVSVATSAFVDQRLESIMSLVKLSQMEQWREKYYGDLRKCKKIVIPIYSKEDGHWFTSVLNIELKTIVIWDSFTSPSVKKMQEKVLKH